MRRNIRYEFAITLSGWDLVDTFFTSPVESMLYAALGCAKERLYNS